MSYRTREARRRKRAAVAKTKREHAETIRHRYYLTIVKRDCRCAACGCRLRRGEEMVFSKAGANGASSSSSSVTLCVRCADADPLIDYRPSYRWERRREQQRPRKGSTRIPLQVTTERPGERG